MRRSTFARRVAEGKCVRCGLPAYQGALYCPRHTVQPPREPRARSTPASRQGAPRPVYHLDAYREALGLTKAQCARACGLDDATYIALEQGKQDPRPTTLRKLAKGLHVAISRLCQETAL